MALTTESAIQEYLKTTKSLALDPEETYATAELSGGTANFVYRLTDTQGSTSIIKHAEPYVRTHPDIQFPVVRMDFEANVLRALPDVLPSSEVIQPVGVLAYDSEAHVLRLSDGGSTTLKDVYSTLSEAEVQEAGGRLGRWLARFHLATKAMDIGDNQVAKNIYRHSYKWLASRLEKYGQDKSIGERNNEMFGSLLATDDGMVCHGDFWPGNVLVQKDSLKMTIVDWEMTRRGNGATDVGQFAAESWLLDRFRGGKGMLKAFLEAYRKERGDHWTLSDKRRMAIHMGTHIAFWPTGVPWGNEEETLECVKTGVEIIQHATDEHYEWLQKSVLEPIFA
ncbi:kinase-like protein [Microthyrium microscopicum]|uniref:Kinase-like protein n=1 Tax=Microthyrium microscopicum TaxID=703497 RepID=A0A6A6U9V5_9PEZI|nr:kinase-like protein [Microthyrium microscopicum]